MQDAATRPDIPEFNPFNSDHFGVVEAHLVYDQSGTVRLPEFMGTPRDDQFQGTEAEKLSESCGRVCYDSFGQGRSSDSYHQHILEVRHMSVLEHFHFTVEIDVAKHAEALWLLAGLLNRPGVWVTVTDENTPLKLRLTADLTAILQWRRWTNEIVRFSGDAAAFTNIVGAKIHALAHQLAPMIVNDNGVVVEDHEMRLVDPVSDHERWITLLLIGSRGFSHEQVRHGDFTAISQRSTRYVDESGSPYVVHPLIRQYVAEASDARFAAMLEDAVKQDGAVYDEVVATLEPWVYARIKDNFDDQRVAKVSARKQARGAARGFLGNALLTAMNFSASVAQWRWMIHERLSNPADAEIRTLYNPVMAQLRTSQFADRFADIDMVPAQDGIGLVANFS